MLPSYQNEMKRRKRGYDSETKLSSIIEVAHCQNHKITSKF